MNFIEKFSGIFLIAGVGLFFLAVIGLGVIPIYMLEKSTPQLQLPATVPPDFQPDYASPTEYHQALHRGRDLYIAEGCWHCHSQYVRPTANENLRYGPVSTPMEYQSSLHLPQLFGTRRVGPDLSREAGKKSNDWHFAHLYQPTHVVPESIMPGYPWYFDVVDGVPVPNQDAKAIVAYLQWLGVDVIKRRDTVQTYEQQILPPRE